jgi:LmbE family N-acetylglucosaminyl deacetylase
MSAKIDSPQDIAVAYQHIYLAPHLDDAALSCGGAIARHIAAGHEVLVVTICAGAPPSDGPLSTFATWIHGRWGTSAADAMALRRTEDVAALESLGADYLWLDFLDSIYRVPDAYNDNSRTGTSGIFGPLAPNDTLPADLEAPLLAICERCPGAVVYAPLGVGNHVDHQATYIAANALAVRGYSVAFYEEFPYAAQPGAVEARLAALGGSFIASIIDIDNSLARKISAIDSYASQMEELFGSAEAMSPAVIAYAELLRPDESTYGERIWLRS